MSVIINGTNLKDMNHNGNIVKTWIQNGILVWQKYVATKASFSTNYTTTWPAGIKVLTGSRSSITDGACIQWDGSGCQWRALTDCKVTLSGSMQLYGYEVNPTYFQCFLYKNGKRVVNLFATSRAPGQYFTVRINHSFNMNAGDIAYISVIGGNSAGSGRAQFYGTVNINAVPA